MTDGADGSAQQAETLGIPQLPERVLRTYGRLWQLETWLRHLVYLELRAESGDSWDTNVKKADGPKNNDKRLTHMPTRETNPLSYGQFSDICGIISARWSLFEVFLPPKDIWEAKLEEVKQIRHRIAHFRVGHHDDLARVIQLLRDIDSGFWTFCTSYNDPRPVLPPTTDPVVGHFLPLDFLPWSELPNGAWARFGTIDGSVRIGMTVDVLKRPWAEWTIPATGRSGLLYNINILARQSGQFDFYRLLATTSHLHRHFVHIMLDRNSTSVRLTLPACIGEVAAINIIESFYAAAVNCLSSAGVYSAERDVTRLCEESPEYVLDPENPLTFLDPQMRCSFFAV